MAVKPILSQDDCAPDALEYFEKDFKAMFGCTLKQFQAFATSESIDDMGTAWVSEVFNYKTNQPQTIRLEWVCDDPYYRVLDVGPVK